MAAPAVLLFVMLLRHLQAGKDHVRRYDNQYTQRVQAGGHAAVLTQRRSHI